VLVRCLQGCNTDAVRALLGGEELSEANLLAHLGIIEQRTNEVLQVSMHSSWQQQLRRQEVLAGLLACLLMAAGACAA
jgi:hypothetical protein